MKDKSREAICPHCKQEWRIKHLEIPLGDWLLLVSNEILYDQGNIEKDEWNELTDLFCRTIITRNTV